MDDLISRKALLEKLDALSEIFRRRGENEDKGFLAVQCGVMHAIDEVREAPTVAAEQVRHGRWVERINHLGHYQYICSECNDYHAFKTDDKPTARDMHEQYRFCRWCGAKMDAKEDAE